MSGGSDAAGGPHPSGIAADPLALSSGRGRWVVAAAVLGSGMAMLDSTVVGIALPSIGRDFHGAAVALMVMATLVGAPVRRGRYRRSAARLSR